MSDRGHNVPLGLQPRQFGAELEHLRPQLRNVFGGRCCPASRSSPHVQTPWWAWRQATRSTRRGDLREASRSPRDSRRAISRQRLPRWPGSRRPIGGRLVLHGLRGERHSRPPSVSRGGGHGANLQMRPPAPMGEDDCHVVLPTVFSRAAGRRSLLRGSSRRGVPSAREQSLRQEGGVDGSPVHP